MADRGQSGCGIGFVGLLTIVFITLKLLGKITWSWWWVLSPVWIPTIVVIVIIAVVIGFILVASVAKKVRRGIR